MPNNSLKSLELFAGAGGLALGLHHAGFKHTALVEWNDRAVKTLKLNCQDHLGISTSQIHHIDARHFDTRPFTQEIDLLAGGPPCQPFSTGGKNLAHLDSRDMFPTFLNTLRAIRPKAILIENVRGLLRPKFQDYFEYILRKIMFPFAISEQLTFEDELERLRKIKENDVPSEERYRVTYQLIDTADFGVPQRRERVFITGFRADLGLAPQHIPPTHSKESLLHDQFITEKYWRKHNISSINYLGPRDTSILSKIINGNNEKIINKLNLLPWKTVRDTINDLPDPVTRGEEERFPNHIQHPGARIYKGHIGSYHDFPAKALKAGTHGTPGGENMLRQNNTDCVRYFTTREAARLHTFPDDWTFNGDTWGACITQLGNAVPVSIGKIFGNQIYAALTD